MFALGRVVAAALQKHAPGFVKPASFRTHEAFHLSLQLRYES
jgi:hypothetical protein